MYESTKISDAARSKGVEAEGAVIKLVIVGQI